jgi:hypothetical protein
VKLLLLYGHFIPIMLTHEASAARCFADYSIY